MAHDWLWELSPLPLLTLLKPLTLLTLTLCMSTLIYFNCLGHHELKNGAHNDVWELYAVIQDGMGPMGGIIPLRLL